MPVKVIDVPTGPLVGDRAILGKTVNNAAAVLLALSVPTTTAAPYVERAPTLNFADSTPALLTTHAWVMTIIRFGLGVVTVQDPAMKPVPETVTSVPCKIPSGGDPMTGLRASVCACAVGIVIEEIEMNNAEVSSKSTRYKELTGRVANFRHAKTISRVHTI